MPSNVYGFGEIPHDPDGTVTFSASCSEGNVGSVFVLFMGIWCRTSRRNEPCRTPATRQCGITVYITRLRCPDAAHLLLEEPIGRVCDVGARVGKNRGVKLREEA